MRGIVPFRGRNGWVSAVTPFEDLRGEMDRLFGRFFGEGVASSLAGREGTFAPVVDVSEDEKEIVVRAEVPGMTAEDIEVSVRDGILTLQGEKRIEERTEGENQHLVERRYGSFQRAFTLPSAVNVDAIDAQYQNGVLTIHLPKAEEARARRIEVHGK